MTISIKQEDKTGIWEFNIKGEFSISVVNKRLEEVYKNHPTRDRLKILVDISNSQLTIGFEEIVYEISKKLNILPGDTRTRVAFVDQKSPTKIVLKTLGLYVKIHNSWLSAAKWLNE